MPLLQIITREFRSLVQKPRYLLLIFGVPVLYTLAFGLLYANHSVRAIPTVIYDANNTKLSRSLAGAFEDSEKYKVVGYVSSEEEMEEYLKTKQAVAAVAIPEKLSADLKKGGSSEVMVVVNGSNIIHTNTVLTSASEIIQTFAAGVSMKSVEAIGLSPDAAQGKATPVQMRPRILGNPATNYSNFMLIGLLMTILQQSLLLPAAVSMVNDRARLETELAQVPLPAILAGKAITYWLAGMLAFTVSVSLAHLVFSVPMQAGLLPLLLPAGTFLVAVVFAGILFSNACPDEITATQYTMLYAVPAFLFSGYTWPREAMTAIGNIISACFPLSYVAEDMRDLMLSGTAPALYQDTIVLLAMGAAFFAASLAIAARRRKKTGSVAEVSL